MSYCYNCDTFIEDDEGIPLGPLPGQKVAADAADDCVRVPRENVRHLLEYIGAMYEKAAFEPRNRSAERALNVLADDIEGWLDGNFKKVPNGKA